MSKKEFWCEIPNTNGFYEASVLGRIRRKNDKTLLRQRKRKDGYMLVNIICNGVNKTEYVHRLIALTFIPNKEGFPCVNHIDENKQNNSVDNLEWCTAKKNNNHSTRGARISKSLCKKVCQYDMQGNIVRVWDSVKDATEQLGIRNISQACRGLRNKAGGYMWRYYDERG